MEVAAEIFATVAGLAARIQPLGLALGAPALGGARVGEERAGLRGGAPVVACFEERREAPRAGALPVLPLLPRHGAGM